MNRLPFKISLRDKLTGDILWNFISFGIIAVNGIILNLLIVSMYDSAALGLFNQVYAVFIILSQLAVNGLHFSVLRTVSLGGTQKELALSFTSALVLAGLIPLAVIALVFPLVNQASLVFDSVFMTQGIKLVLPGLLFFSLNKVILAFLNGQRRMKLYAVYQTLRSLFLLGFLLLHAWLIHDGNTITMIFTLSEGLVFICLIPVVFRNISIRFNRDFLKTAQAHFLYGLKATGGNILLELNTKLDVLILGLFVSDSQVGIYSFAALFIEGFMQLPVIIRNNINPLLATKYHQPDLSDFRAFIKKVIRFSYFGFVPLGILGMLAFPLVGLVKTDFSIQLAWLYFVIMLAGMLTASGYLPLQMTFNQAGKPGLQSLVLLATTFVLAVFLVTFTALFGTLGAALGMGLTYGMQAMIIGFTIKKITT